MEQKNIFIFDQNKCVACHACVVACMNENGFQIQDQWRNIHSSHNFHYPGLPIFYLSLACNHCDDAPCKEFCPALAYVRDKHTGAVIHDASKCIGCKYCTWTCPYDAPKYVSQKGIIEKCTFCNHRIEVDLKPSCAYLCPVGALDYATVDFSREESFQSSPVKVDVGSKIKVIKLRDKKGPEQDMSLFDDKIKKPVEIKEVKISALKDRPLLIFSLISAFMVSLYASELTNEFDLYGKLIFMGTGIFSAFLSLFHLGKKLRAWRSVLNIRRSWLSREIVFMILFYAAVLTDFFIYDLSNYVGIVLGLLLLYSIDMLYRVANWNWPTSVHSAQTLLIAFTITLFVKDLMLFLSLMIFIRLILYIFRKQSVAKKSILVSFLRVSFLLTALLPLVFEIDQLIILCLFSVGEIIDRIEFYNELNVSDPGSEFIKL
jgi:Fe-S-cluster-containing dehydrogenase component/DMSO reductase anchor subunit